MANKLILDSAKIDRMLHRMAYEIWEKNFGATRLIFVGISPKGPLLAKMLEEKMREIHCDIERLFIEIWVEKENLDFKKITLSDNLTYQEGDVIIVVDDVLYTGGTMMHCILPFVQKGFFTVQVAVLVFRDYLRFPIRPDFVGTALASTTQQHVEVVLLPNASKAFLD